MTPKTDSENAIKTPMMLTLKAGNVIVAEVDDAKLWAFVMEAILAPPDYTLDPLPPGFLPPGYRSLP